MPFSCFFKISDGVDIKPEIIVDLGMIYVRYLKLFNYQYGNKSNIGKLSYNAPQYCFENKGNGTHTSNDAIIMLVRLSETDYFVLGKHLTPGSGRG